MNLFLDDDRKSIKEVSWIKYPEELEVATWTLVKSYEEFVSHVLTHGVPKVVSFDHDLDDSAYRAYTRACQTGFIDYNLITGKTGFHAVNWLMAYCQIKKAARPICFAHSHNRLGYWNIRSILAQYKCDFTVGLEKGFI